MNYIPTEFGWWGIFTNTPYCEATYPEELEYVMGKALALGCGFSLETQKSMMDKYGRTNELLDITKNYITLMKQNYFSSTVTRQLAEPGKEFKLKKDSDDRWKLHRIKYSPEYYVRIDKDNNTSFYHENQLHDQPLQIRLKAMTGLAHYGDPENITLEDFDDVRSYTAENESRISSRIKTDVKSSLTSSTEQMHNRQKSGKFEAHGFKKEAKNQWCTQKLYGNKNYNLLDYRVLGLWIYGSGSGNLLDIQLFDKGGYLYHSHYVDLDFDGWKYFEFQKPEGDRAYDYQWPYGSYFGGRNFNYESVSDIGFTYLVNKVPESGKLITYLSKLEAFKEYPAKLINPSITVNGKIIKFPVTIEFDNYLEFFGSGAYKVYDVNAELIAEGIPEGEVPMLRRGKNKITISSNYECKKEARAKITIITISEPLGN